MKLKSHIIIFLSLLFINLFISYVFVSDSKDYSNFKPREVPDKVKFKSAQKEEALVIKTNKASGTTKLEINMKDYNGKLVNIELKAKIDPNNPRKIKYKYRDGEDDKATFVSVKYPDKEKDKDKDSFKINLESKGTEVLVCKVKFGDGKLKIGSDKDNEPAYELKNISERKKKKSVNKIKVFNRRGIYVACVSQSSESGKYKVKKIIQDQEAKEDLYSTNDLNYMSYSIGVLGLEEMDPKLRAVIVAEILKKEK